MKEKYSIKKEGIILFKIFRKNNQHCQLKDFINFLNFIGEKKPLKFSYVDIDANLLGSLTLKENIFLESIPNSLANTKEFQLQEFLEKKDNRHLAKLFDKIDNIDLLPNEVSAEVRKLTTIVKGFLQDMDYLFFESPERHLSSDNLKTFIRALRYHVRSQSKAALVCSSLEKLWLPFCSSLITYNQKKEFQLLPNERNSFKSFADENLSFVFKGKAA